MADDNKNIPPSAGEAAKEIMDDDKNAVENKVETVDRKTYEDSKKLASAVDYGNKSGAGWKVATLLLAIVAIGACGACVYMSLNESNGGSSNDSNRTKCDVKVADGVDNVEKGDTVETTDSPNITRTDSGEYILTFLESGISVNLGSNYEFINYSYSASAPFDDNFSERINIGGLSKNTTGAQNIPEYASGRYEFGGGTAEDLKRDWSSLVYLDVYSKTYYDANIQPKIDEIKANGGPVMYGTEVYRDDDYVVVYSHAQNSMSQTDWEQEWEMATFHELENAVKNSANWSR